jgi:hypothetical protein
MGISVEEYLAKKQACQDCITHGNEDHCVTTLLSREDNCLVYNMVWAYHIPNRAKHMSFTPDERNRMSAAAVAEAQLFISMRAKLKESIVVEYYTRAENLVKMIKGIHQNDRSIWSGYYTRFMPKILEHLRAGRDADAMAEIWIMIDTLEYTNGRVICTWLRNNGLFSAKDLAIDTQFSVKYLNDNTKIGYWLWACPLVQYMEKNYKKNTDSLIISAIRIIAQARANEIAYQTGARRSGDMLGKMVRIVGESACFVIGLFARPLVEDKFRHWLSVYSSKIG